MGDNMEFEIGDLVTRKSYNNDTIFEITDIVNDICYLKGINIRLLADSDINDLNKFDKNDDENEQFEQRIKPNFDLNRDDYFYIPGKILHIDSDILLSNDLLNPYKIRKKAKIQKYINHQKKQKMSKI